MTRPLEISKDNPIRKSDVGRVVITRDGDEETITKVKDDEVTTVDKDGIFETYTKSGKWGGTDRSALVRFKYPILDENVSAVVLLKKHKKELKKEFKVLKKKISSIETAISLLEKSE